MKIKTQDLIGPALDWAVAKCESVEVEYINDGITRCLLRVSPCTGRLSPSTDWSQGGPIIEQERLDLTPLVKSENELVRWFACTIVPDDQEIPWFHMVGPTALIAAMRCFVASHLGDEVDVPDELTGVIK